MASSYKAFISYSHADERWAKWLHRSLERYRVPRRLIDKYRPERELPNRLFPVFRDQSELSTSSDLGGALKEALSRSETLIVICSPAAASSRWLNEEIKHFKGLGREDRILCMIVDGEPDVSSDVCAFPPALLRSDKDDSKIEYLAADPRADGRHDALLKVIGGVLQVGIDDLKQRDVQRRVRTWASIAVGSGITAIAMVILAFYAITAEREAQLRRGQAEGLIGFMLGDLRQRLEPIGRLDILDSVGDEAMNYFELLDENATSQDLLSRAMALRQIGEVRFSQGQLENALQSFVESRAVLQTLFDGDRSIDDYLFELGQSEFWVGYVYHERAQLSEASDAMDKYMDISLELLHRKPNNKDYQTELAFAYSNLGTIERARGDWAAASKHFAQSVAINEHQLAVSPDDLGLRLDLGGGYSWIGSVELDLGHLQESEKAFRASLQQWTDIASLSDNAKYRERIAHANLLLSHNLIQQGHLNETLALCETSYDEFHALIEQDPDNNRWRRGLASTANSRAEVLHYLGLDDDADEFLQLSLDTFQQLVDNDPTNAEFKTQYSLAMRLKAISLMDIGKSQDAHDIAAAAYKLINSIITAEDAPRSTLEIAAFVFETYAQTLTLVGEPEIASEVRRDVFERIRNQPQSNLLIIAQIAVLARGLGEVAIARDLTAQLAETGFGHPAFNPRSDPI